MSIRDHLHDLVDSREEGRELASAIVDKHMKETLKGLLLEELGKEDGDPVRALERLAEIIGQDLDPLTTARVRVGFEMTKQGSGR